MRFLWFLALLLSHSIWAKTVYSLDEVYPNINHSAGREFVAEELGGVKPVDYLGRDFFSKSDEFKKILALVDAKKAGEENWHFAGIKAWPSQPDTYIFIACSSIQKDDNDHCHYLEKGKTIIAVLHFDQIKGFSLMAKPWIESGTDLENSGFLLNNDSGEQVIGNPRRYDFAPYRLSSDVLAFGVRHNTSTGYAGGGAFDESVTLFAVINGELLPVFNAPTYHFANYAGDWHEDGTRDHELHENVYIIRILSTSHSGMKDILWPEKGNAKKVSMIYHWNKLEKRYTPVKKSIIQ
ncbi:hypothetical protein [Snodgrassella alvi]|uniref:hypothetical protein n=1 Tax=Snodgrassella alvi TaxID=1196083 RepID=UPI000CC213F3|nr:hypothetical protein [Snodgrassella alvi]PIT18514.1 hypothetical protein BGI33_00850 [Snodgrassella alvi]